MGEGGWERDVHISYLNSELNSDFLFRFLLLSFHHYYSLDQSIITPHPYTPIPHIFISHLLPTPSHPFQSNPPRSNPIHTPQNQIATPVVSIKSINQSININQFSR